MGPNFSASLLSPTRSNRNGYSAEGGAKIGISLGLGDLMGCRPSLFLGGNFWGCFCFGLFETLHAKKPTLTAPCFPF
jgi:hypothetical protein